MKLFILGINSFIGTNFYLKLRTTGYKHNIVCLSHNELDVLKTVSNDDVIFNFCGVNRGKTEEEFVEGNTTFLKNLIGFIPNGCFPHLFHISSFMVHGFEGIPLSSMVGYSKMFIESKLKGEKFLRSVYPEDRLTIIRPSNIYGYNCEPYYNNILVTMAYESVVGDHKVTKLNKNCMRNFLSVEGLVDTMCILLDNRKCGTYDIVSNNDTTLDKLIKIIYKGVPNIFEIVDGEPSVPNKNSGLIGERVVVEEDFIRCVEKLTFDIKQYGILQQLSLIKKLDTLSQPRGDMVEISGLDSKRLYMITVTKNSFRGNHFHYMQTEEFYVNRGKIMFLLALENYPNIILCKTLYKYDRVQVAPYVIHTLVNDFVGEDPEIFVTSTQKYVPNSVPDTKYINIIPYE